MRINGSWYRCNDGELRPVIQGVAQAVDDTWVAARFLVDIGADLTVFSADALQELGLAPQGVFHPLSGVGGVAAAVVVPTAVRLFRDDGGDAVFRGQFQAFTDPTAIDMSVLGRNLLNEFAVVVDWPQKVVCLLNQRHSYVIVEQ